MSLVPEAEFQRLVLADFDEATARPHRRAAGATLPSAWCPRFRSRRGRERSFSFDLGHGHRLQYEAAPRERAEDITPLTKEVMAHELTHALDDQWFGLDRPALGQPRRRVGLRVHRASSKATRDGWRTTTSRTLSADEQEEALSEQDELVFDHPEILDFPSIITTLNLSPYDDGPDFVQALLDERQTAAPRRHVRAPADHVGADPGAGQVPRGGGTCGRARAEGRRHAAERGRDGRAALPRDALRFGAVGCRGAARRVKGWGGDSYVTWSDVSGRSGCATRSSATRRATRKSSRTRSASGARTATSSSRTEGRPGDVHRVHLSPEPTFIPPSQSDVSMFPWA